jgi:hypothetical protein
VGGFTASGLFARRTVSPVKFRAGQRNAAKHVGKHARWGAEERGLESATLIGSGADNARVSTWRGLRWYRCLVKRAAEEFRGAGTNWRNAQCASGSAGRNSNAANNAKRTKSTSLCRCSREAGSAGRTNAFGRSIQYYNTTRKERQPAGKNMQQQAEWECQKNCECGAVLVSSS